MNLLLFFHLQDFAGNKKGSFDQMLAEGDPFTLLVFSGSCLNLLLLVSYLCNFFSATNAQSNTDGVQASVPGKPVAAIPATNLNIGMDLWNPSSAAAGGTKMRPNPAGGSAAAAPAMNDQWIQV